MFSLLLLPPVCGLCLFLGLLTATRGPLVRLALTLVLTGLVAPIVGVLAHSVLPELPVVTALALTAVALAGVLWRVVPRLPMPQGNVRGLCWALVLTSCTLTTVALTSPTLATWSLQASLLLRLILLALPFVVAHLLVSRLPTRTSTTPGVATKRSPLSGRELHCTAPALPLLARPLELVGADAPYFPLASALTAGAGPAAAFSCN
jgi:hypothetical protein